MLSINVYEIEFDLFVYKKTRNFSESIIDIIKKEFKNYIDCNHYSLFHFHSSLSYPFFVKYIFSTKDIQVITLIDIYEKSETEKERRVLREDISKLIDGDKIAKVAIMQLKEKLNYHVDTLDSMLKPL